MPVSVTPKMVWRTSADRTGKPRALEEVLDEEPATPQHAG
jgi:hypothetical protein